MLMSAISSLLIIVMHEFVQLFILLVHLSYVVLRMNYLECTPTFLLRVCDYFWCIFLYFTTIIWWIKVVYKNQIGVNISQGTSKRCASVQFQSSRSKVRIRLGLCPAVGECTYSWADGRISCRHWADIFAFLIGLCFASIDQTKTRQ